MTVCGRSCRILLEGTVFPGSKWKDIAQMKGELTLSEDNELIFQSPAEDVGIRETTDVLPEVKKDVFFF